MLFGLRYNLHFEITFAILMVMPFPLSFIYELFLLENHRKWQGIIKRNEIMIAICPNCKDKPHVQDEIHGNGKRVFNPMKKKNPQDNQTPHRCTVCQTIVVSSDKK